MAESKDGRIQDGCHHQVESEWMSEVFLCKMVESMMAEFKMAAIIKLSQKNEFESEELDWVRVLWQTKMAESKMAEFKMVAIIKLVRLN